MTTAASGSTSAAAQAFATTSDGVRLAVRRWAPAAGAARRAVVLCGHAMMANGRYFERGFAQHLAARGIDVFVLDWRGHGASVPPSPRRDRWTFEHYVERDLPAAIDHVAKVAGVAARELCYLGHSLGGLVGLAAFGVGRVPAPRRLSLWATSVWLPGRRGPWRRRALMKLYDWSTRPRGYAPVRALRVGTDDEQRGYVRELTGWAANGRWPYADTLHRIASPTLAVTGAQDRLSRPADAQVLLDRLPGALPLRVVDGDHFSLFTRTELAGTWDELSAFLQG